MGMGCFVSEASLQGTSWGWGWGVLSVKLLYKGQVGDGDGVFVSEASLQGASCISEASLQGTIC